GDNGSVYVWDATDGTQRQRLVGHDGVVMSVAWSPDGIRLASAGSGREDGELFVWEAQSGQRVRALVEHPGAASAVAWSPSGEHLQTLRRDRPYERLNITGIRGLSAAQKASLHALGAIEEAAPPP